MTFSQRCFEICQKIIQPLNRLSRIDWGQDTEPVDHVPFDDGMELLDQLLVAQGMHVPACEQTKTKQQDCKALGMLSSTRTSSMETSSIAKRPSTTTPWITMAHLIVLKGSL